MVKVEEFYFDSRDRVTKVHAVKWIPDTEVKCVLQIVHGMAEYIMRYDEFARFLASQGVLVTGCDNLGHGKTAATSDDLGYICEQDGETVLVRDVHRLKKMVQGENIGKPYFILGHSMGSFIVRNYLWRYGKGIQGALILSTGEPAGIKVSMSMLLGRVIALFRGWKHRSDFINWLCFHNYNRRIDHPSSPNAWISTREKTVTDYDQNEKCGFHFTINAFYVLGRLVMQARKKENLAKIPKSLPVYFLAGLEDPVGNYGKGVSKAAEALKAEGLSHVDLKIYDGDRHELLNEENRYEIFEEIYQWIISVDTLRNGE